MSDADTDLAEAPARHNPKLVKHVARIISGLERPEWAQLDAEAKKPHMAMAKRVLKGIDRYGNRQESDGA
jgi:hypothetical protein